MEKLIIYIFHILFVSPLLYLLATDQVSKNIKEWIIYLAVGVALYHTIHLIMDITNDTKDEHMSGDVNGNVVHYITMIDSSPGYSKPVLRIKQGDVVVWKNIGTVEHSISAVNEEFFSGYLKPADSFSVTFITPGQYHYYDVDRMGWMRGMIIVE